MQKISFIGATFTAGSVGLGVFAGWGCQLYGVRTVATIGTIIYVGGNLAASSCTSITALILTQGLLRSIGAACLFTPGTAIVGPYFDKRRGLAFGIASSGGALES